MYFTLIFLLSPLLASSLSIYRPNHENKMVSRANIEFWSSTPPTFICTTTTTSPTVEDVHSAARELKEPSKMIRVGEEGKTPEGDACVIAGKSGKAVVELCAKIGVGFPAMTPMRVAETVIEKCQENVNGVMRAGGYAVFWTGTKITVK